MRPGTALRIAQLAPIVRDRVTEGCAVLDVGGHDDSFIRHAIRSPRIGILVDRQPSASDLDVVQADAAALPLTSGCMDAVLLLDVLEHIEADAAILRELRRVTRADGTIIVSTPMLEFALPLVPRRWLNARWGHVRNGYALPVLRQLLQDSHFEVMWAGRFHGLLTRLAYTMLYVVPLHHLLPRVCDALFARAALIERRLMIRPLEHVIVARAT